MRYIIEYPSKGYLIDFDFHGKQEYSFSTNPADAWVFKSISQTRVATRWIRQSFIVRGVIRTRKRVIVIKLAGGKE